MAHLNLLASIFPGILAGFVAAEALGFGVLGGGYMDMRQGIGTLLDTIAAEHLVEGVEEDDGIEPEGEALLIAQVIGDALTEGEVVSPLNLRQA